jgi:hypothetical protein
MAVPGSIAPGKGYCTAQESTESLFCIEQDEQTGTITVFRSNGRDTVLVQVALADNRPYIHPIMPPDGNGVLTQYRPGHHLHQTGLYWGFKMVNGRDYFMGWQPEYWRRVSVGVVLGSGDQVQWKTVYDMLDESGNVTMTETHTWSLQERDGKYLLDLVYSGQARTDITFGEFYVGGLFLRMPLLSRATQGEAINAAGQRNGQAEGQRAVWTDVGMEIAGRDDFGHIAMFDHPDNNGFPVAWRVDGQLGVGPSRQILGDWKLAEGDTEIVRYRLAVYTGELDANELHRAWTEYATGH